ncbi:hypothetical protein H4R33_003448 [Dimargaris cristalligena]|nr:hypothetical protein H4R33_003448 [Dimargaris cristalligena]
MTGLLSLLFLVCTSGANDSELDFNNTVLYNYGLQFSIADVATNPFPGPRAKAPPLSNILDCISQLDSDGLGYFINRLEQIMGGRDILEHRDPEQMYSTDNLSNQRVLTKYISQAEAG